MYYFKEIEHYISKFDYTNFWNLLISDDFINSTINLNEDEKNNLSFLIGNFWRKYVSNLEKEHIKISLSNKKNQKSLDLLKIEGYFDNINEFKGINLYNKNIIFIGSGPNPESILKIENLSSNSKIFGLDLDLEAINLSKQFLLKLNLDNIDFINKSAINMNYSEFDIIFIANGIIGKKNLLKKIISEMSSESKIILRNPILSGEFIYDKVDDAFICENFNILNKFKASILSETIILNKK